MFPLNDASKKRYDAFWNGEVCDRFLTYIAVGSLQSPMPDGMSTAEQTRYKWENIPYRTQRAVDFYSNARYYLDGFATEFINFGPGSLAPSIGGNFVFADDTVWFDRAPVITDWESPPHIALDESETLWQKTLAFTDAVLNTDNIYASVADLGSALDIVASLRGTQELLYDFYDYPNEIKEMTARVGVAWKQAFTKLADRILARQDGLTSWMPIWCRERYSVLQCDISAMLSPDMFLEFALPDIKDSTEFLDRSIYHLDGPDAIKHTDALLTLPRLNAIQWMPGAGVPDVTDPTWFELYDKIQSAGKGLVLFVESPDSLEPLLRHLSPRGVFLSVNCPDDTTAREVTSLIEGIGVGV